MTPIKRPSVLRDHVLSYIGWSLNTGLTAYKDLRYVVPNHHLPDAYYTSLLPLSHVYQKVNEFPAT